LSLLEDTGIF